MPLRIFLVDPSGTPRRFPVARYERLIRREPDESLPEFTDGWACFAQLYFHIGTQGSVSFGNPIYLRVKIGRDGRADADFRRGYEQVAMSVADPGFPFEDGTISGERHWASKKLREQFGWEPTLAQQRAMRTAILRESGKKIRKSRADDP